MDYENDYKRVMKYFNKSILVCKQAGGLYYLMENCRISTKDYQYRCKIDTTPDPDPWVCIIYSYEETKKDNYSLLGKEYARIVLPMWGYKLRLKTRFIIKIKELLGLAETERDYALDDES
jgi:hypothetical protein